MGGLHLIDLAPLVVLALVIFGPKRLPELGGAVGRTIREFQRALHEEQNLPPSLPSSPSLPSEEPTRPAVDDNIAAPGSGSTLEPAVAAPDAPHGPGMPH